MVATELGDVFPLWEAISMVPPPELVVLDLSEAEVDCEGFEPFAQLAALMSVLAAETTVVGDPRGCTGPSRREM